MNDDIRTRIGVRWCARNSFGPMGSHRRRGAKSCARAGGKPHPGPSRQGPSPAWAHPGLWDVNDQTDAKLCVPTMRHMNRGGCRRHRARRPAHRGAGRPPKRNDPARSPRRDAKSCVLTEAAQRDQVRCPEKGNRYLMWNSMRRFWERPSSIVLSATGSEGP